MEGYMED